MSHPTPFDPTAVYPGDGPEPPRVLIAPHRYVQGPGVLGRLARLLSTLGSRRPVVLLTEGGEVRLEEELAGLAAGVDDVVTLTFGGRCTRREVRRLTGAARAAGVGADALVALGGGSCLDAGRCVARRLGVPFVSCPTVASTDAPCSAVSVLYTEEGAFDGVEHLPESPALVIVDTAVVARAPARYLVAGMGDALSTGYEARTCFENPEARTLLGTRMTVAGLTLAERCGEVVTAHGRRAVADVREGRVTEAVERIVEANTLLSGMGFEGGGIAAAHALATGGLAAVPTVEERFLHGERVAFGVLFHLALEDRASEAREAAAFLASVGLPAHLGQLGVDRSDRDAVRLASEVAAAAPPMANEPFGVTPTTVERAVLRADAIGRETVGQRGDGPYRRLHDPG